MKWSFVTCGQILSLSYVICKYWYIICKVLFIKWKKENLQILDLQSWKAMCISKRTQRPLEDMMGSLSPFISTKMLVVVDMWITFGTKLWHKEKSPLCNTIFLWRSVFIDLDSHLTSFTTIYSPVFSCLLAPYPRCPVHCQYFYRVWICVFAMILMTLGFTKNVIFLLTIFHHQVIKCLLFVT